jgi:hypothetical protein
MPVSREILSSRKRKYIVKSLDVIIMSRNSIPHFIHVNIG